MLKLAENRGLPEAHLECIKLHMQELMSVSGVYFVMLCSSDGFELHSMQKRHQHNTGKLAAVSSSILAMISAFLKEIQFVGCQSITLDADNAKAILSQVGDPNNALILVTLADQDVLLGQLRHLIKKVHQDPILVN